jgi:hypothetical protein
MTPAAQRRERSSSHRLTTCGNRSCSRLFAVCGRCDRGRRFCSRECAGSARRSSLQRAGQRYQGTDRGRQLHAARQARYRDRLRSVTHQSSDAKQLSRETPEEGASGPAQAPAQLNRARPPDCSFCARRGAFLRNGFFFRAPRRTPGQHRASVAAIGRSQPTARAGPLQEARGSSFG